MGPANHTINPDGGDKLIIFPTVNGIGISDSESMNTKDMPIAPNESSNNFSTSTKEKTSKVSRDIIGGIIASLYMGIQQVVGAAVLIGASLFIIKVGVAIAAALPFIAAGLSIAAAATLALAVLGAGSVLLIKSGYIAWKAINLEFFNPPEKLQKITLDITYIKTEK